MQSAAIRAEALNVVAYAKWQLGSAVEALALLDRALATHPVEAYAVNAALIAADDGARVALPYLARVVDLTTRPRVRQGAVAHAIDLWLPRRRARLPGHARRAGARRADRAAGRRRLPPDAARAVVHARPRLAARARR